MIPPNPFLAHPPSGHCEKDRDLEILSSSAWLSETERYITGSSEHNKDDEMFRLLVNDLQEKVKKMKYVYNLAK